MKARQACRQCSVGVNHLTYKVKMPGKWTLYKVNMSFADTCTSHSRLKKAMKKQKDNTANKDISMQFNNFHFHSLSPNKLNLRKKMAILFSRMNGLFFILSLLFVSNASLANKVKDITTNKDVNLCVQKYGEENSECLEELNNKTEEQLNKSYNKKLKEIETFDYTRWWMGDEERRKGMIENFKNSQSEWLKYRNVYCNAAVTGAQSTHFLGADSVGCIINMNNRRISEIEMIQTSNVE